MSKFLFLDIDGVLNNDTTTERFNGYIGVDQVLLKRFQDWVKRNSDVQIVLSSTWRRHDAHMDHLEELGLKWVGETPELGGYNRRQAEIELFLEDTLYNKYAILDDFDVFPNMQDHLVLTDATVGLQDADLEKLDRILND